MNRHQRRGAKAATGWMPLELATAIPKTPEQMDKLVESIRSQVNGWPEDRIRRAINHAASEGEIWKNDVYQVHMVRRPRTGPDDTDIVHLSIRRIDRAPCRDWRDFQRIKNQLVGPECEAIELYPAESRVVDTANQFHLWCIDDPWARWPVGFDEGRVIMNDSAGGSVQRPRELAADG